MKSGNPASLNRLQRKAVRAVDGPLLVIAGAGSGKTRVIEYRVLHLVQNGVEASSILLLTFTRRAAREMLERASKHDPRCARVEGGTFHSLCYKMLRRYGEYAGFPRAFSVLDEGDCEEAIHKCSAKLGFYNYEKKFPKKRTLRNIISISVNKNSPIEVILDREYGHFLKFSAQIKALKEKYTEYKSEKGFVDYDDLLVYFRRLLLDEPIRKEISGRYRYIMVDEYQDTNYLQGEITCLLGKAHTNVMVVGDDAQSIYGFRGASHKNIMDFPKFFPGTKVIKLEENYRSTQDILEVGNAILENMSDKYSKRLVSSGKTRGDKPRILFFKNIYDEAEWIAESIKSFFEDGTSLEKQAVLFRNLYISIPLQAELGKLGIPYRVYGGMKFYETAHVKDVMAHLKIIANPKDELSWNRVLMLLEGIGGKRAEAISDDLAAYSDIKNMVDTIFKKHSLKLKKGAGLTRLGRALKAAANEKADVGAKFGIILDYYNAILRSKFDDWNLRENDLDTLRQISGRYKKLDELLSDFAIEPPDRGVLTVGRADIPDEELITISTIHSAKGLEWDAVFLMGLVDGVLPSRYALGKAEDIEEERRLFYVAVTRAKKHLFFSAHHEAARAGIEQFNRTSRFVEEPNVLSALDCGVTLEEAIESL